MKVLLIEDCDSKSSAIESCLNENSNKWQVVVIVKKNLAEARRAIIGEVFDLIIFDIFLPFNENEEQASDVSEDLITEFSKSRNYLSETVAITKYQLADIRNIERFNQFGIPVVTYCDDSDVWKIALRARIERLERKQKYDFLVFCALSKEREGFSSTELVKGEFKIVYGLNCLELTIGDSRGLCIVPKWPGLVNMAVTASKAIELFQPKIVAMSGICAGVEGNSNLLDLVVAERCWEYQTGKYKDGKFKFEPYQTAINSVLHTELVQFCEQEGLLEKLKNGLYFDELKSSCIRIGPLSSGSAVVASREKVKEIEEQNRKMCALEMEMYSMYEAARQSLAEPLYFGAKVVVDMADEDKGDKYHVPAIVISARFVSEFLKSKLPMLLN